jgi:hypothetical protein
MLVILSSTGIYLGVNTMSRKVNSLYISTEECVLENSVPVHCPTLHKNSISENLKICTGIGMGQYRNNNEIIFKQKCCKRKCVIYLPKLV